MSENKVKTIHAIVEQVLDIPENHERVFFLIRTEWTPTTEEDRDHIVHAIDASIGRFLDYKWEDDVSLQVEDGYTDVDLYFSSNKSDEEAIKGFTNRQLEEHGLPYESVSDVKCTLNLEDVIKEDFARSSYNQLFIGTVNWEEDTPEHSGVYVFSVDEALRKVLS